LEKIVDEQTRTALIRAGLIGGAFAFAGATSARTCGKFIGRNSMERLIESRREFLRTAGLAAGALMVSSKHLFSAGAEAAADYAVRIKAAPIEIAPNQTLSTITYNGQFPGPLVRFQEGREVTVDIFNKTDTPE
jgi:hypothetical protein